MSVRFWEKIWSQAIKTIAERTQIDGKMNEILAGDWGGSTIIKYILYLSILN